MVPSGTEAWEYWSGAKDWLQQGIGKRLLGYVIIEHSNRGHSASLGKCNSQSLASRLSTKYCRRAREGSYARNRRSGTKDRQRFKVIYVLFSHTSLLPVKNCGIIGTCLHVLKLVFFLLQVLESLHNLHTMDILLHNKFLQLTSS